MAQPIEAPARILFYVFSVTLLATLPLAIYTENYVLALTAPLLLFLFVTLNDIKLVYLLLWFVLPLSTEVELPYGFATDFPSELLIGGLMLLFIPLVLSRPDCLRRDFVKHPLIFLLFVHYLWIWITTAFSDNIMVSVKFSLAKTWYLVTFVLVTGIFIRDHHDFRKAFGVYLVPLLFTVIYTLVRHAQTGFAFATVNDPMLPFYRNHVAYACVLAQSFPLVIWFLHAKGFFKNHAGIAWGIILLLLAGVGFAYTRSAWIALILAGLSIPLLRLRLLPVAVAGCLAAAAAFFLFMAINNRYLDHQPDFEKTVYHPELVDHLEATLQGRDVSSAERIYRWVAAFHMWSEQPLTGFGPGNFNNFYKQFTVTGFRTWVSDNPERSSVHNYFLQILTEQGIIGLLIFIAITIMLFVTAQRVYNQSQTPAQRQFAVAITLALVVIYVNNTLSDLIETDKVGSFFFIITAVLINLDVQNRKSATQQPWAGSPTTTNKSDRSAD